MKHSTLPRSPSGPQYQSLPFPAPWPARLASGLKRCSLYTLGGLLAIVAGLMILVMTLHWDSVLLFLFGD